MSKPIRIRALAPVWRGKSRSGASDDQPSQTPEQEIGRRKQEKDVEDSMDQKRSESDDTCQDTPALQLVSHDGWTPQGAQACPQDHPDKQQEAAHAGQATAGQDLQIEAIGVDAGIELRPAEQRPVD